MNIRFISIKNKSTRNLKRNIKALKGTYIVYVLLCAIFLLGIVLGSLYVAKGRLEDGVIASIEMKTTKSDASEKILYNSLWQNGLLILFFWIVGLSVIGAPILLFAIFLDGISIGITISYILSTFGLAKGYSFIYIILYVITIINVGVMIMLCQSAINVMYNIIGKNKDIRHSGVCILMSIALVVSSILEMYMMQIGKNII